MLLIKAYFMEDCAYVFWTSAKKASYKLFYSPIDTGVSLFPKSDIHMELIRLHCL